MSTINYTHEIFCHIVDIILNNENIIYLNFDIFFVIFPFSRLLFKGRFILEM